MINLALAYAALQQYFLEPGQVLPERGNRGHFSLGPPANQPTTTFTFLSALLAFAGFFGSPQQRLARVGFLKSPSRPIVGRVLLVQGVT
jgi:hypothetical protein